jgi:hypothetical protein
MFVFFNTSLSTNSYSFDASHICSTPYAATALLTYFRFHYHFLVDLLSLDCGSNCSLLPFLLFGLDKFPLTFADIRCKTFVDEFDTIESYSYITIHELACFSFLLTYELALQ